MKLFIEAKAYLLFYDLLIKTFVQKEFGACNFFARTITGPKNWRKIGKRTFRVVELFEEATTDRFYFYRIQRRAKNNLGSKVEIDRLALILALEYIESKGDANYREKITDYSEDRAWALWEAFKKKYMPVIEDKPHASVVSINSNPPTLKGNYNGFILQGDCVDICRFEFHSKTRKNLEVWYERDHPVTPEKANFHLEILFSCGNYFTLSYCNINGSHIQHGTLHLKLSPDGQTLQGKFVGYFVEEVPPKRKACEGKIILKRNDDNQRLAA